MPEAAFDTYYKKEKKNKTEKQQEMKP